MKPIKELYPKLKRNVASYDPSNFMIFVEDISEEDLLKIRKDPFANSNIEHIKTLFHEIRHYIDHVGTLWGQKKILRYIKAINARMNKDISKFDEIVAYKNEESQLFYSNYYAEEFNYIKVANLDNRWRWTSNTGLRFSHLGLPDETKPIPFIHFANYEKIPLIRVPISIAALLETNSTNEEIQWHQFYLMNLSELERPFHSKLFERETLIKLIYNQDLVVYNVAVHITSNLLNITDAVEAFKISSKVATLALNLPYEFVKLIPYDQTKFISSPERSKFMIENNEYGFIFYLLLENYSEKYKETKVFDSDSLLNSSGLPAENIIKEKILEEMSLIFDEANQYDNLQEIFLPKLELGMKFFSELGIFGFKKLIGEVIKGNTPTLICNNTDINFKTYSNQELFALRPFKNLNTSDWYNISDAINTKISEHYQVRGA